MTSWLLLLVACLAPGVQLMAAVGVPSSALSSSMTSLLSSAGTAFTFPTPNSAWAASWSLPPTQFGGTGMLTFDTGTDYMDACMASNYIAGQSRLPCVSSGLWYLPIASSCNYAASPASCPTSPGSNPPVVSSGWTSAIWVNFRRWAGYAHIFSASGGGYSLRISVNTAQNVQLVSAGGAASSCTGNTTMQLYNWYLVLVTQTNSTGMAVAPTSIYLNGALEASCSMPYWFALSQAKPTMYIGYDPVLNSGTLHAQVALWAFFYAPLNSSSIALLVNEPPLAISGPLRLQTRPAINPAVPLLVTTQSLSMSVLPPEYLPGSSSTLQLCLVSVPAGAGSPACVSWSSATSPLTSRSFVLSNPQLTDVLFTFNVSFTAGGTLPAGTDQAYWQATILPPSNFSFTTTASYAALSSSLAYEVNFTSSVAMPAPTPALVPFTRHAGGVNGTYIAFLDHFHGNNFIDLQANAALVGNGLPPGDLRPLLQGFTYTMFVNTSSVVADTSCNYYGGPPCTTSVFSQQTTCTSSYGGGPASTLAMSVTMLLNNSIIFTYGPCTLSKINSGAGMSVYPYQWLHVAVTVTEFGLFTLYYNGLPAATSQCATAPLPSCLGATTTSAFIGAGAGNMRAQYGAIRLFNRLLLDAEVLQDSLSPPLSLASMSIPLHTTAVPPVTLKAGVKHVFGAFLPHYWGANVTLWMAANDTSLFPNNADLSSAPEAVSAIAAGALSVTSLSFSPSILVTPGMSASTPGIKTIDVVWPAIYTGSQCVQFSTWITGDTTSYAPIPLANWTTCTTQGAYVASLQKAWYSGTFPPVHALWQNRTRLAGASFGIAGPAGFVVFNALGGQSLPLSFPNSQGWSDVMEGALPSPVRDMQREGRGFTLYYSFMLVGLPLKTVTILQWGQFAATIDTSGTLRLSGQVDFDVSGAPVSRASSEGCTVTGGSLPANVWVTVGLVFDPRANQLAILQYWDGASFSASYGSCQVT